MKRWISYSIVLCLLISVIQSVTLDQTCSPDSTCSAANLECLDGTCRCKAPWFQPCKNDCTPRTRVVYESEPCEVTNNCGDFMQCSDKICRCSPGFTAKNGLCYKALNATCSNSTECWSGQCTDSSCACRIGYEPDQDNISCRRKLVKLYNNFNEANAANDLCSDSSSCVDILATCQREPLTSTSGFCKCPSGYIIADEKQRCDPVESSLLSPLLTTPSSYGECATCQADNAVCINAAKRRTCWCRAGYIKRGEQCVRDQYSQPLIIFPNTKDRQTRSFAANCQEKSNGTNVVQNSLCVCATGYKFQALDQTCRKIHPLWIGEIFEYGLCTRITSTDDAIEDNRLCPAPSTCEEREDKHICSCGRNQFIDLYDPTQCVYYIGRNASTSGRCPTRNAARNPTTGFCECNAGYIAIDNNRSCDINLSLNTNNASCSSNRSNDNICVTRFGRTAILCNPGECRCSGNQSFPNTRGDHCYALLNQTLLSPRADCPPHAVDRTTYCQCERGFRPSSDARRCEPLLPELVEFNGTSPINSPDIWNTQDCLAYFKGPVQYLGSKKCQCQNGTFINDAGDGCWYLLTTRLPDSAAGSFCPDNSSTSSRPYCDCFLGYSGNDRRCERITDRVYARNDPSAVNITGVQRSVCNQFFGTASDAVGPNQYCVCKDTAFSVRDNKYCHFYIGAFTSDSKARETCPENTNVESKGSNTACVCNRGYHVASDNRSCETSNIPLVGNGNVPPASTPCGNYTRDDCIVKYGANAFCQGEQCYCDQSTSYKNKNFCEPFSGYTFPALHELPAHTCIMNEDCGNRANVQCNYLDTNHPYKVCQCQLGFYLNPQTQTCDKPQCTPNCDEAQNFECKDYQCVCKMGFYLRGSTCVPTDYRLEVDRPCNSSAAWQAAVAAAMTSYLVCDASCERARCLPSFRPENRTCVRYQLGEDRCGFGENNCSLLHPQAICSREENVCACGPSFYQTDNQCARAVGGSCATDGDCGGDMLCEGRRCKCNDNQHEQDAEDIYQRPIKRCVSNTKSGVDPIRFNLFLVGLMVSLRLFFI